MRLLAATLLLTACNAEPYRVRIDHSLSASCVENVIIAHEAWAGRLGFDAFEVCESGGYDVVYVAGDLSSDDKSGRASTIRWPNGDLIKAVVTLHGGECHRLTVEHEIGHLLSLRHRNDPGALMHEKFGLANNELTPAEIEKARLSL